MISVIKRTKWVSIIESVWEVGKVRLCGDVSYELWYLNTSQIRWVRRAFRGRNNKCKGPGVSNLRTRKEASKVRGTREMGLVMQTVTGHRSEVRMEWAMEVLGDLKQPRMSWASLCRLFNLPVCACSVAQLCPVLCNPVEWGLPGSSVHGILQAGILEWAAIPSSRGSSQSRDRTQVSHIAGRFFTIWATGFPCGSVVKESACQCRKQRRHWLDPWVGKIPWRRKWQLALVFLPGESYGQGSLAGYSPWGCKESDVTEWLTYLNLTLFIGKGKMTPIPSHGIVGKLGNVMHIKS